MGKYVPVFDLVFGVILTLLGMAGFRLFGVSTWRRAAASITLLVIAVGIFGFLLWVRVQGIGQETHRQERLADIGRRISKEIQAGESIEYRMRDDAILRDPHKCLTALRSYATEIKTWREQNARFLASKVFRPGADTRFLKEKDDIAPRGSCRQVVLDYHYLVTWGLNLTAILERLDYWLAVESASY